MAGQENCVRVTRASRKRVADVSVQLSDPPRLSKKRVVLGELTNLSNALVSVNPNFGKGKGKTKGKGKAVKAKRVLIPVEEKNETKEKDIGSTSDDPQLCEGYVGDILDYLRELEVKPSRRPSSDYFEKVQKDVTANMRGVLVDWLVEVAEEYRLVSDTLYLTVSYVDRYLSKKSLTKQKLQLLGVSSMLVASRKYEEIKPPTVEDFCYITDNTYMKDEIVKMEADILASLKFELGGPTILTFLRRFSRVAHEDDTASNPQLESLALYLGELSLLDFSCVKFLPSLVAASVVFLARFIIQPKNHPWPHSLQEYTTYKTAELKECVLIVHDLYLRRRGAGLRAIREKYKQERFECVATLPSPPDVPVYFFEDVQNQDCSSGSCSL